MVVVNILVKPNHYCRTASAAKKNGGQNPSKGGKVKR
jgi:hypothetical protein